MTLSAPTFAFEEPKIFRFFFLSARRRLFLRFLLLGLIALVTASVACVRAAPLRQAASAASSILTEVDQPFLFSYLSWQDKVKIENGHALLRGDGVNGQGGAGFNVSLDLSRSADELSPALRLRVGAGNRVKMLKLVLRDTNEHTATYEFELPAPTADFVQVTPRDAAPLTHPNSTEGGSLDFARIMQWQLVGDWSTDPVDIEVDAIELALPTVAMQAERAARAQKQAREREKTRQEQAAQKARYSRRTPLSPRVASVAPVAPDVLAIAFESGQVLPATLEKYTAQPGDATEIKKRDDGKIESVLLTRGGKTIGYLLPAWGPKRPWLRRLETFTGDPLLEFEADNRENYAVASSDDAAYSVPQTPLTVYRKSKPINWSRDANAFEMRHIVYLKLPRPLTAGKAYTITLGEINTREARVALVHDAVKNRSEAVHVHQIGYRPDDPAKRAFVSCWMGTGGALHLPATLSFALVDDKTGQRVFSGQSDLLWPADKNEKMARDANFNGTDVARLDFSAFRTPGRYRVVVDGIGCSYPFTIGPAVWRAAFATQMRGLLNNRSGIPLGPPYTPFQKPPDMVPAQGYKVTKTTYRAVEKGGEAWAEILGGDTGKPVPEAWGGYHDAGDWNPRRVTHLKANMASLEVFDLFPKYFAAVTLNIPPTPGLAKNVPDILAEAAWELETFLRLQQPDGGVPYGIETGLGDPLPGEVSWLQSFPAAVLTADYFNSWYYAAAAARLAYLLKPYDPARASVYQKSAVRAFEFAEQDFARDKAAGLTEKRGNTWEAIDFRNLAAVELLRLTRAPKYHQIFLLDTVLTDPKPDLFQWTVHVQREQAFVYARLPRGVGDDALKKKAVLATEEMAERALAYAANNAFNLTTPDQGKPQFIGFYSTPDALDLTRAHFLTGKKQYLAGALQATQFQSGANPSNIVYTSGLGANPIRHPFHLDSRSTGQSAPPGLTPYGNVDFTRWNDAGITWPITWYLSKNTTPDPYAWPTAEAYWDIGQWPMLEEYTVDAWAPNLQVWGYLAARPAQTP